MFAKCKCKKNVYCFAEPALSFSLSVLLCKCVIWEFPTERKINRDRRSQLFLVLSLVPLFCCNWNCQICQVARRQRRFASVSALSSLLWSMLASTSCWLRRPAIRESVIDHYSETRIEWTCISEWRFEVEITERVSQWALRCISIIVVIY